MNLKKIIFKLKIEVQKAPNNQKEIPEIFEREEECSLACTCATTNCTCNTDCACNKVCQCEWN